MHTIKKATDDRVSMKCTNSIRDDIQYDIYVSTFTPGAGPEKFCVDTSKIIADLSWSKAGIHSLNTIWNCLAEEIF